MRRCSILAILLVLCAFRAGAADHFVNLAGPNPTAPYLNWDTAATNIQDAIDAAAPGDRVMVTNGVYASGGTVVYGTLANRIAITKPLTVQSVNGPDVTIIQGYQLPGVTNGPGAVRCVYMTNDTTLIGFTITHGATDTTLDSSYNGFAGGVLCENYTNSVLSNCVIIANSANSIGGVLLGTLNNCLIASNSATMSGGGVWNSTLNHCTVQGNYAGGGSAGAYGNWGISPGEYWTTLNDCVLIGNSTPGSGGGAQGELLNNCLVIGNQAGQGGGAANSQLYNCTVVSNTAASGAGIYSSTANNSIIYYNNGTDIDSQTETYYSCTPVLPFYELGGSITAAPLFVNPAAGDFHLQPTSPCINSGDNNSLVYTNTAQGDLLIFMTNSLDGNPRVVGGTVDMGAYEFQGSLHYVSQTSTNPLPPYSAWNTAATNIQDAIDAADPGDTVLVTNGLYNTGGRMTYPPITNRVAITKSLVVESVNGPAVTIIEGYQVPGITNGDSAIRCVYMTNNTSLIGFTVTHGATSTNSDPTSWEDGGGILCSALTNSVISNCVIIYNSSATVGGGVVEGTLNNCVIANNSDVYIGGGAAFSVLNHCLVTNNYSFYGTGGIGGNTGAGVPLNGQTPQTANFCVIMGNSSGAGFGPTEAFGGADNYIINHCLIIGNKGDGAIGCRLFNCTVVSNSIGIEGCQTLNSIVYYNDVNYPSHTFPAFLHSCTTPLPSPDFSGYATLYKNITNAPLFVDPTHGDFHLQPNSPCINAGYNNYLTITNNEYDFPAVYDITLLTNDFDGNPRLVGGTVDLGAYEFQSPASQISFAWLQQYGLALDGSADNADPDGDGMSNWQEWRAGTLPLDNTSLLLMLAPSLSPTGATLTWQSQTNVNYYIQRTSQPGTPFSTIQSNLVGQVGTTSYTDTNAAGSGPFFYRVGVQ